MHLHQYLSYSDLHFSLLQHLLLLEEEQGDKVGETLGKTGAGAGRRARRRAIGKGGE